MQTTKCASCEAEITENDFVAITIDGKDLCESCEQSSWEYANTVVTVKGYETKKYLWCQDFGFRDAENWDDESPNGVNGFKYIRTDGWRGYWDVEIDDRYTNIANGWSTGRWSDVAYKHSFNDFVEQIQGGEVYCPFELIFSFALTSNVFSVTSDVIILTRDVDAFNEWIADELGLTVEDLQSALN